MQTVLFTGIAHCMNDLCNHAEPCLILTYSWKSLLLTHIVRLHPWRSGSYQANGAERNSGRAKIRSRSIKGHRSFNG